MPALARSLVLSALGVAPIVAQADVRHAIGLPGHRGLLWLTVLAVVGFGLAAGLLAWAVTRGRCDGSRAVRSIPAGPG
jgi:hypothetical protein